ncbi:MAG TPA: Mrp/NBP35 family ATP-binding protein [Nitrospiria bacterium]|jgi:ATP-binding protein involved in chromosome partitioning|nr:Mrp/NBP35 family ATP-binding protein [Nitrospiria bacterium]
MPVTEKEVLAALSKIQDPDLHKDIVALGFVQNIKIRDSQVGFDIVLTTPACPVRDQMREEAQRLIAALPGVSKVDINMTSNVTKGISGVKEDYIPLVKNAIAISSGKGGVGKSTVSATLAVALAETGAKVGLMDADFYGPNIPMMMGAEEPPSQRDNKLLPAVGHGVKLMSMGYLVPEDQPIVWRGPMIHGAIQQFLRDVEWGELDYLLVDLPPGTGDAQLSISQLVPLTGAVIVTTPQNVALHDSKKGLAMFQKVNVPVLGIIENMSYFVCSHCHERTEIFSHGGGRLAAEKLDVPFLGEIPIDPEVRVGGDSGAPVLVSHPDSPTAEAFRKIARAIAAQISIQNAKRQTLKIIG